MTAAWLAASRLMNQMPGLSSCVTYVRPFSSANVERNGNGGARGRPLGPAGLEPAADLRGRAVAPAAGADKAREHEPRVEQDLVALVLFAVARQQKALGRVAQDLALVQFQLGGLELVEDGEYSSVCLVTRIGHPGPFPAPDLSGSRRAKPLSDERTSGSLACAHGRRTHAVPSGRERHPDALGQPAPRPARRTAAAAESGHR